MLKQFAMKHFVIACLTIFTLSATSQTTPPADVTQAATATMSDEMRLARLEQADSDLKKQEKIVSKLSRQNQKSEKHISNLEIEINYNEKQQADHVSQIANLKASMAGYDLEALETKIKRLDKESSKLTRNNNHNANAIVRKKAHIEKLLGEISVLENEISENEIDLARKEKETENTQDVITSNGLVDKQASIEKLDKELASLKSKNERMRVKSDRERNSIQKNQQVIHSSEGRVIQLQSEKQQLTGDRIQAAKEFN